MRALRCGDVRAVGAWPRKSPLIREASRHKREFQRDVTHASFRDQAIARESRNRRPGVSANEFMRYTATAPERRTGRSESSTGASPAWAVPRSIPASV